MLITENFFKKDNCCSSIVQFLLNEDQTKYKILIKKSITDDYFSWFNDNITAVMNKKQCVQYAIYAVELVLPIFEDRFPNDKRPRKAIEAAKKWIIDPSEKNRDIVYQYSVTSISWSRSNSSSFANSANDSGAYASRAVFYAFAQYTSKSSFDSNYYAIAYYAYYASRSVAAAFAASAYAAATANTNKKIIQYGLKLLEGRV